MRACDCPHDWHLAGDPRCERICGRIAGGDGGGGMNLDGPDPRWRDIAAILLGALRRLIFLAVQ